MRLDYHWNKNNIGMVYKFRKAQKTEREKVRQGETDLFGSDHWLPQIVRRSQKA